MVAADFDGNGTVDIAFSEPKHGWIGVLSGNGDGTFATRVDYVAGESPAALVVANLNGDTTSLLHESVRPGRGRSLAIQAAILLGQKYAIPMTLGIGTIDDHLGHVDHCDPGRDHRIHPTSRPRHRRISAYR